MSKTINVNAIRYLTNNIDKPIFSKTDIIELIFSTIVVLLTDLSIQGDPLYEVRIHISKMSRVFFKSPNRIVSIVFPFSIKKDNEKYVIYDTRSSILIDSIILSSLQTLFNQFETGDYIEMFTLLDDFDVLSRDEIWNIFSNLLSYESGYIRYEYDLEHFEESIHPIHHFDINHTNSSKYKLGFDSHISLDTFIDILDTNTNCYFIKK